MSLYDGETFTHKGYTFKVELRHDDYSGEPWRVCDGHGEVTGWEHRDKEPGERVLVADRHGAKRFYDFAGAVKTARKDEWGCKHGKVIDGRYVSGHTKAGERAACAANDDYEYLRAWCNNEWEYLVIGVTQVEEDEDGNETEVGETEYLGGVESSDNHYVEDTARELADEIISRIEVDTPDVVLSEN